MKKYSAQNIIRNYEIVKALADGKKVWQRVKGGSWRETDQPSMMVEEGTFEYSLTDPDPKPFRLVLDLTPRDAINLLARLNTNAAQLDELLDYYKTAYDMNIDYRLVREESYSKYWSGGNSISDRLLAFVEANRNRL